MLRQATGRKMERRFIVLTDHRSVLGSTLDEIYATKEYKDGTYPVMSYQPRISRGSTGCQTVYP